MTFTISTLSWRVRIAAAVTGRSVIAVVAALGLSVQPSAQSASDEYRLKAAFVHRFPEFVQWPAAAMAAARMFELCVLQPNPFGRDLDQLVDGDSLDGRPLRVRTIRGAHDAAGCHALFAGAGSEAAAALKAVAGRPVLTIGETDTFLRDGGIIVLRLVDRRVRFEVSATNAQRAGLRISAQLLSLASAVHGGRK